MVLEMEHAEGQTTFPIMGSFYEFSAKNTWDYRKYTQCQIYFVIGCWKTVQYTTRTHICLLYLTTNS